MTDCYTVYIALKNRLHLVTYHDHQQYGTMLCQFYPLPRAPPTMTQAQ
ncbi:hypothetical protein PSPO01_13658 [Paraphaeosphaeria sporulosa]